MKNVILIRTMRQKILYVIIAIGLSAIVGLAAGSVNAIEMTTGDYTAEASCGSEGQVSFTSKLAVDSGRYDVYAKLDKRGQVAQASVFAAANDTCHAIGEQQLSGDAWTHVGEWSQGADYITDVAFELSSAQLGTSVDANRPTILLVAKEHPVCTPTTECYVTIGDKQGYVRPAGSLSNTSSLRVAQVVDPEFDTIESANFYVDGRFAYKTDETADFDMRYASAVAQKVEKVIRYNSGQTVIIDYPLPDNRSDSFGNFLFRLARFNPAALYIVVGAISLILVWLLVVAVLRVIIRRRNWRIAHGFLKEEQLSGVAAERKQKQAHAWAIIRRSLGIAGGAATLIAVVVVVSNTVFSLYKIDGHSMENTFHDEGHTIVNRIPVTLAHLNGGAYTPKRGQVVILREAYGAADDIEAAGVSTFVIKRVIGLPGETVRIRDEVISISNAEHPDGFVPDETGEWRKTMRTSRAAETIDLKLGADELFVVGDNREGSVDSRANGPIQLQQLVGNATIHW